jgi:phosphoribosylformylglycinamidine synthase PurS subunit
VRRSHVAPRTAKGCMLMADTLKVRVLVRPKEGILDPQGEAVRGALPALGFRGVRTVHVGRLIEMEVESADEVDAMCRRLLSNPTVEEYEWEVVS